MESAVLNSIKEKVHTLMSNNSSLKEQNIQLETKVSELKNTLKQQKSEIEQQNTAVKTELSKKQIELASLNKQKIDLKEDIEVKLRYEMDNFE
jgi:predicted nuclease with TOPRIM domain